MTTKVPYWGEVPVHEDWQDFTPLKREMLSIINSEGGGFSSAYLLFSDLEGRLANELYDMIIEVEKLRGTIRSLEQSLRR